ncbi:Krr1-domain-containing protein [Lentinus tigrinus ALCF2SS1-7]|uniref:Krr1-domain-containing protein n=1 Tax=Lentinus tigrinus ALCF2SS1-6 TaxID=1328759 RepID=A0A5C2S268_9APHY|nr:Krr1-domain-containing protein [Lentinus tigrinus ALCF2SS1-6]RPD78742.1 Krr1-domain-containing protein [Lentinus tigrinus ALCF2SS1-7]
MLSDDSDFEDIHTLTINEHYAKAFEHKKEREELAKLKEKYGSDVDENDEEDSEEDESEDEEGEELTPAMDAAILRTLARIKRKDPSIYESEKDVFEEERQKTGELRLGRARKDKSKPLTMRQHALASALEEASGSRTPSPEPLTHVEEQSKLRDETIAAFHTAVGDEAGDEAEDDFLVLREKTKDEIEKEDEEYRAYLQREVGEDLSELITIEREAGEGAQQPEEPEGEKPKKKSKKEKKKAKSGKSKQDEDQEFLMNYILNRGWIDQSARRLPTYKEITGKGKGRADAEDNASGSGSDSEDEGGDGEQPSIDDDEFDEVADRFESSYNFRFEEPGAAEIARHPRNLDSLVRRQDTSRKEAREKRKARKEEELLKKKEEVNRLKALKMKELRAKLERIGHEGGKKVDESKALQELDLEGDWDPDAHDRQMAQLYANDAAEFGADDIIDDEKPTWDDDIDIGDIVPPEALEDGEDVDGEVLSKKKKKKKKKKGGEDAVDEGGVNVDEMDADIEHPAQDDEEWDGTEEMRRQKLEEYMDEIYGLDFNDMVAGMPTRFRYVKVEPQTFGLTPAEILMATDAELNTFMGIKKYAPYRKEGKGRTWDGQRVARLQELKAKLKERGVDGASKHAEEKVKKRKGKKERMREKAAAAATEQGGDEEDGGDKQDGGDEAEVKRPKEKKRKRDADAEEGEGLDTGAGEGAKKKRRRHRKTAAAASS